MTSPALANNASLSGVTAGTVTFNRGTVDVEPTTDSLEAVVARVNAAGLGVTASWNAEDQRVSVVANRKGRNMRLDDGGNDLFDALHLREGTIRARRGRVSSATAQAAVSHFQRIADTLGGAIGSGGAVAKAAARVAEGGAEAGLRLTGTPELDVTALREALQKDPLGLVATLEGEGGGLGVLVELQRALESQWTSLRDRGARTGITLDRLI